MFAEASVDEPIVATMLGLVSPLGIVLPISEAELLFKPTPEVGTTPLVIEGTMVFTTGLVSEPFDGEVACVTLPAS